MYNPIYTRCIKCNKKLSTRKAMERGYGDYCWEVHKEEERRANQSLIEKASLYILEERKDVS